MQEYGILIAASRSVSGHLGLNEKFVISGCAYGDRP